MSLFITNLRLYAIVYIIIIKNLYNCESEMLIVYLGTIYPLSILLVNSVFAQLTFLTSVVSQFDETKTCMMSYHQHECHGDMQQQASL